MKLVVNRCWGGFSVPDEVVEQLGLDSCYAHIERTNPVLVEWVETHTDGKDGHNRELRIVEIPDGFHYLIDDYDGMETVYYSASEIEVA